MPEYYRPSIDTKFHIDFDWWQKQGKSLRVMLSSHLCPSCWQQYSEAEPELIDWVDPQTGEVKQVDLLWNVVRTCCSQKNDFVAPETPLVTAVFLTFIANDNAPLTPVELHQLLASRPADLILRTIGRHQVYYGIRPATVPTIHRKKAA